MFFFIYLFNMFYSQGILLFELLEAKNLKDTDVWSKSDPYAKISGKIFTCHIHIIYNSIYNIICGTYTYNIYHM